MDAQACGISQQVSRAEDSTTANDSGDDHRVCQERSHEDDGTRMHV